MNLLSLQPALRTLTCDYNCLKRQVQDFPFMLDKAITEAKQEVSEELGGLRVTLLTREAAHQETQRETRRDEMSLLLSVLNKTKLLPVTQQLSLKM